MYNFFVIAPTFGGFGSAFGSKPFGTTVTTASPFSLTTPFAQGEYLKYFLIGVQLYTLLLFI